MYYHYNQSKDFDEIMSVVQVKIGKLIVKDVILDREFGIDQHHFRKITKETGLEL
jgi:hypothetical protein